MADVVVNIAHTLTPITRAEFSRALLLVEETQDGVPVGEYRVYDRLEAVGADYGTNSVAYALAAAIFAQRIRPADVAILNVQRTASRLPEELTSALDAAVNAGHTGWYFLVPATRSQADRLALVNWVDANRRFLVLGNADSEDVGTIISSARGLGNSHRTAFCAHGRNEADRNYLEAALVGWIGGRYPGSAAWFHAKVNGITPNTYTYNELLSLEQDNVISWHETPVGIWATTCGKTVGGEWCDITQAIDFLEARLKERIWSLLVDRDRIPFTQEGIDLLRHAVLAELHRLARSPYGIIATDAMGQPLCRVLPLRREEIDRLDVRNRRIPDLRFEATVAGAVKSIVVNGVLTEDIIVPYPEVS